VRHPQLFHRHVQQPAAFKCFEWLVFLINEAPSQGFTRGNAASDSSLSRDGKPSQGRGWCTSARTARVAMRSSRPATDDWARPQGADDRRSDVQGAGRVAGAGLPLKIN
jgi:hypothetical protein